MFEEYIGDGVYVSFDGYQIWLAANDHNNKVIAIDPDVWTNLVNYVHNLPDKIKENNNE
jgi:hypothetical protein